MENFGKLTIATLVLAITACIFAFGAWLKAGYNLETDAAAQTNESKETKPVQSNDSAWLKGTTDEKFAQIEKHLRGLDVAMAEIGYRYSELHFAAKERNWEYAKYQTDKIDLTMRLALERRPKRAASSQPFLNEDIPAVKQAIESKNAAMMNRALERLTNSCIACHRSENVLYFRSTVERLRNAAGR